MGCRELAEAVQADDWIPDLVLGISRGGLLVAGALAYALGVKNTATISVEFYTGVDERLELPMLLPPVPDLVDLTTARVLIADDVADTGATLELVRDFCAGRVAEARVAVLYEKSRSTVASHVRLAANRPLDHVPVERAPACHRRGSRVAALPADRGRRRRDGQRRSDDGLEARPTFGFSPSSTMGCRGYSGPRFQRWSTQQIGGTTRGCAGTRLSSQQVAQASRPRQ